MPRHSRTPKTNRALKSPATDELGKVKQCWKAYERFAMLGAIALELLQLMALKFSSAIWQQHRGFLRTRSHALPSERTVKQVIMPLVVRGFLNSACSGVIREIRTHYSKKSAAQPASNSSPDTKNQAA